MAKPDSAGGMLRASVSDPEISVVLPVYNAAGIVEEAIASVRAQGHKSLEIVIVDDGSTDNSAAVIDRLRAPDIRAFKQDNQGPSAARNRAIRESRGKIIAMIDADDLWPQGKLELQLGRLRRDPELLLVGGRIERVSMDGNSSDSERFPNGDQYSAPHLGAVLFRREAFDVVGLFDESLRFSEDQDWFLRAREQGLKMLFLKEVTLIYRRHQGNMTATKTARDLMFTAVLKKSLDRRRKAAQTAKNLSQWSGLDEESE